MELALLVSEPADLSRLAEPIGGVLPSRLYFGNEFCERLLMTEAQLDLALATEHRLTIVLPYLSPQPFARAEKLLARIASARQGTEIVCNDWGVLRAVAREPRLVPLMGRCLNRTLCDPRLPEHVGGTLPAGALAAMRGGPFASPAFGVFADRYRVSRVELDEPPLGLDPAPMPSGFGASIHYPFAFVASGRVCLFAALGRDGAVNALGERFTPGPCRYECRDYELALQAPPALAGKLPIVQRGNTVFVRHDASDPQAVLTRLAAHADRIVWSHRAPMGGGPSA